MDRRAKKILFDAYWSSAGWRPESERRTSSEDFAYAKSQGVMFDPVVVDHERAFSDLDAARSKIDRQSVADAFLAGLSTRRLEWRSAFGSAAVFRHLGPHAATYVDQRCTVCGAYSGRDADDLNVLNFERLKWGGVRHDDILYAALDLRLFSAEPPPRPTAEDVRIFRALIAALRSLPSGVGAAEVQRFLAPVFPSNKAERDVLVALLGFSGILDCAEHPSYADAFVPYGARPVPSRRFVDMPYPACWWTSDFGVSEKRLAENFGHVL